MSILESVGHNHQMDIASRVVDKLDDETKNTNRSSKEALKHAHEHGDLASVLVDKVDNSQLTDHNEKRGHDAASDEAGAAEASSFSSTQQSTQNTQFSHAHLVKARAQTAGLDHHHETAQVLAKVGDEELSGNQKRRGKSIPKPQQTDLSFDGALLSTVATDRFDTPKKSRSRQETSEGKMPLKQKKKEVSTESFVKKAIDTALDHGLELGAAAAGAAIGSIIPGAGTIVGAVIGLALGCIFKFVVHKVENKVIDALSSKPTTTSNPTTTFTQKKKGPQNRSAMRG